MRAVLLTGAFLALIAAGTRPSVDPLSRPAEPSACRSLRAASIIPAGAPALVIGDPGNPGTYECLAGRAREGLRSRFVLHPWYEDEPRLIHILGGPGEPSGPATDEERELMKGPPGRRLTE